MSFSRKQIANSVHRVIAWDLKIVRLLIAMDIVVVVKISERTIMIGSRICNAIVCILSINRDWKKVRSSNEDQVILHGLLELKALVPYDNIACLPLQTYQLVILFFSADQQTHPTFHPDN